MSNLNRKPIPRPRDPEASDPLKDPMDQALADSFPASDPVSVVSPTKAAHPSAAPVGPPETVAPGIPGPGEAVCPRCHGSGRVGRGDCPDCAGSGTMPARGA
jgi:hypothetical protein